MTDVPATPAPAPAYATAPVAVKSSGVGTFALILGLLYFIGSIVASVLIGNAAAPFVETTPGGGVNWSFDVNDPNPQVAGLALAIFAHVGLAGFFGLLVIILAIVAIATRRGRGRGIFALILGIVTPGISFAVFVGILTVQVASLTR